VLEPKTVLPKLWYRSKLFWFNVASGAIASVVAVFQLIQDKLDAKWYLIAIGVINAVNVGLRFITTSPIYTKQLDKEYVETLEKTNSTNT